MAGGGVKRKAVSSDVASSSRSGGKTRGGVSRGRGGRGRAPPRDRSRTIKPRTVPRTVVEESTDDEEDQQVQVGNVPELEEDSDFVDVAARDRFNNKYRHKPVTIERAVDEDKVNQEFVKNIKKRGWGALLKTSKECPNLSLVRQYFANAKSGSADAPFVTVRGVRLRVSREAIEQHFGFKPVRHSEDYNQVLDRLSRQNPPVDVVEAARVAVCPETHWLTDTRNLVETKGWPAYRKLIFNFYLNRLRPSKNSDKVFKDDLKFLLAFIDGTPIDAAKIIRDKLTSFNKKGTPNLFFAHMITDMARKAGVEFRDDDVYPPKNPVSLVQESTKARPVGQPRVPQLSPNPIVLRPSKISRAEHQRIVHDSLASIRDWMNDSRQATASNRTILDHLASQANFDTSALARVSQTPYEFPDFMQRFIPSGSVRERERGETSGGAVGGGNGVGGDQTSGVGGEDRGIGVAESDVARGGRSLRVSWSPDIQENTRDQPESNE